MAVLVATAVRARLVQIQRIGEYSANGCPCGRNCPLMSTFSLSGILGSVRVHSHNFRSHMFIFYTSPLAVLCRQHIRLGAVRMAHRWVAK